MLWQKESDKPDALYVNICDDPDRRLDQQFSDHAKLTESELQIKNNTMSIGHRNKGNVYFAMKKWRDALECYNQSLCFAETDTDNISLAYGNRSACFFHLKKYDKCLIDIELAKESNYPKEKLPKLEERQAKCSKMISTQIQQMKPKLSFEPEDKFPGMANMLQIKRNAEMGRYISTKSDIDVGQTVLIEQLFVATLMSATHLSFNEKYKGCNICLNRETNLVPCQECTSALFCRKQCEGNHLHACGIRAFSEDIDDLQTQTVRSILIAMNTCPNVEELIQFVEQAITTDSKEIPESLLDAKSKYRAYLKLCISPISETRPTFHWEVYMINRMLLCHPVIGAMFSSEKHRRFLMHLIGYHVIIDESNAQLQDNCRTQSIITCYFNHSCTPNVSSCRVNNEIITFAIRPIQAGEQLFVTYLENVAGDEPDGEIDRNDYFNFHGFRCKCSICNTEKSRSTTVQSNYMKLHPCFQYVNENFLLLYPVALCNFGNDEKKKMLMEKCVEFLRQFGRLDWTKEMGLMTRYFSILFKLQFE